MKNIKKVENVSSYCTHNMYNTSTEIAMQQQFRLQMLKTEKN